MNFIETEIQTQIISNYHHECIVLNHPIGTFNITPASKALLNAIEQNRNIFSGIGIDWGSGIGCLSIFAAKVTSAKKIYGLEISSKDVHVSKENARINNLENKVFFFRADSYKPYDDNENKILENLKGSISFIIANPPSSDGDDGLGFRRKVLKEGRTYLHMGGLVFLNISFQYGEKRIANLINDIDGYQYLGEVYSSEVSEFDLSRTDLMECIKNYIYEEKKTKVYYTFLDKNCKENYINAYTAYNNYKNKNINPLTKWQTYLFKAI